MAVRTFRPALGALVVLLLLVCCADSEAGLHCRRQRCGNDCCAIPCWVRWFDSCERTTCPSGYYCYCCNAGQLVQCGSGNENCGGSRTFCWDLTAAHKPSCGGYGG